MNTLIHVLEEQRQNDTTAFTVSGVMAGFGFTAVLQYLAAERASWSSLIALCSFILATILFLYATLASILVLESIASLLARAHTGKHIKQLRYRGFPQSSCYVAFGLGFLFMLSGMIGAAWSYSTLLGIGTAAAATATLLFLGVAVMGLDYSEDMRTWPDESPERSENSPAAHPEQGLR